MVWFVLKQLDSLNSVKKFQMPSFTSPKRVRDSIVIKVQFRLQYTAPDGVPFYMISIFTILMGNATLAEKLVRFPVKADGPYTWVFRLLVSSGII